MHKSQCFCLIYNFFRVNTSSITYIQSVTVCKYLLLHCFAFSITARVVVLPNLEIRASEIRIQFRIRVSMPWSFPLLFPPNIPLKGGAPKFDPLFEKGAPPKYHPLFVMYPEISPPFRIYTGTPSTMRSNVTGAVTRNNVGYPAKDGIKWVSLQ